MDKESNSNYKYDDENEVFNDSDDENNSNYSTSFEDQYDFIVDTLQNYGCKQQIDEIEDFLNDYGDKTLFKWYRDLQDSSIADLTCKYIEQLLSNKFQTQMVTPPIGNVKIETSTYFHENTTKVIPIDKTKEQLQEYSLILPPSNIDYYDLSPYVNTAVEFYMNIVQLKEEITRILIDSGITEPFLIETALNKELEALTGYDPKIFSIPSPTASASTSSAPTPPTLSFQASTLIPTLPSLLPTKPTTELTRTISVPTAAQTRTFPASIPTSISISKINAELKTTTASAPTKSVPSTSSLSPTAKSFVSITTKAPATVAQELKTFVASATESKHLQKQQTSTVNENNLNFCSNLPITNMHSRRSCPKTNFHYPLLQQRSKENLLHQATRPLLGAWSQKIQIPTIKTQQLETSTPSIPASATIAVDKDYSTKAVATKQAFSKLAQTTTPTTAPTASTAAKPKPTPTASASTLARTKSTLITALSTTALLVPTPTTTAMALKTTTAKIDRLQTTETAPAAIVAFSANTATTVLTENKTALAVITATAETTDLSETTATALGTSTTQAASLATTTAATIIATNAVITTAPPSAKIATAAAAFSATTSTAFSAMATTTTTTTTTNADTAIPSVAIQACSSHLACRHTPVTPACRTSTLFAHPELKSKFYKLKNLSIFIVQLCLTVLFITHLHNPCNTHTTTYYTKNTKCFYFFTQQLLQKHTKFLLSYSPITALLYVQNSQRLSYTPTMLAFPAVPHITSSTTTMLDMPAPTILDVPVFTMLDMPAFLSPTMLDVPAILLSIMLNAPALQYSSRQDGPAHKFPKFFSNSVLPWSFNCIAFGPSSLHELNPSATAADRIGAVTQAVPSPIATEGAPLWTLAFITFGPSNSHDPGPTATDQLETPIHFAYSSITFDASPLRTPFTTFGPSNPHDPGPSAAVADYIITAFTHLAFPAIFTNYALIDFLRTPPRSPSIVHIIS
jgi:hypothetical protein